MQQLIREVLLFLGLEDGTELLLDSATACGREGVGTVRHLPPKVFWPQQAVKRGVVTFGACASAENRADVHRVRQLRQWNGLLLDRNENSVNGDKEDGQDEAEQQGAAVQTISDPGQGDEESWTHRGTW